MKRVLVTGANGFIGQRVISYLNGKCHIRASLRKDNAVFDHVLDGIDFDTVTIGNLSGQTNWSHALSDVDVIIHLAGRAHITNDTAESPIDEFRKVNRDASLCLLKQAAQYKVSRLVFVSSIGVNGNTTEGSPFCEESVPNPVADYALSKLEAEQLLVEEASRLGIELTIVRPPLVYGPSAPGNLDKLIKLVKLSPILPFGLVNNRKSFISIDNLADFLVTCAFHPKAANELFLIADDQVISTKDLTRLLAKSAKRSLVNIPVPLSLLKLTARMFGKGSMAIQLFDDLVIDNSKAKDLLGWKPVLSTELAVRRCIEE
ncbi:hypothetical protein BIT28_18915 [Photobacterium proteolyticum]|uniref:NAD-dependent epimerase/dehydratase domain-containing protein n=1 Tax=Photobacterium proteolyticum TaxID=1903952 RepID=A0A1Q9GN54_9GAMM|nr:NAD-dependent epimerase/dehydratase family protein [Photobacterium proteolyticum]OLQ76090.1 hypothetical protein BIT28_18915 [Photobacterium proteolyticum]